MIDPLITVTVDDRRLYAHFDALPPPLQRALLAPIQRWANRTRAGVQAQEPNRTGRLRSETQSFVDQGEGYTRGRVRVLNENGKHNLKATALEYGSHRVISLRAHTMSLGHFWDRPAYAEVPVRAHPRITNLSPARFLRDVAAANRGTARAEIEAAVSETVRTAMD